MRKPAIVGIAGHAVSADEEALFASQPPMGVILFARNIASPTQLQALAAQLRALLGDEAVLMVDQEGGRVARLRPPYWHSHPPAADIGALFHSDKVKGTRVAWLTGYLIGRDCAAVGFNVVCAPVLDVASPGGHDVIGDRAFGSDAQAVATLGQAMAEGLLAAGVQPVAKHIPGHGRARADSHFELPVVSGQAPDELLPFQQNAFLPWAMTAHILYTDWDSQHAATVSPIVIERIIRGAIGFQGVLVSDDLAMRALQGRPGALALAALAAGCDVVLHCSGVLDETREVLQACPPLSQDAQTRLTAGRAQAAKAYASISYAFLEPGFLLLERDRLLA
jgi:beta-N-acetylhexosaminidase